MRRYNGTFEVLFGTEHRMKEEEMEERFNKAGMEVSSRSGKNHRRQCRQ